MIKNDSVSRLIPEIHLCKNTFFDPSGYLTDSFEMLYTSEGSIRILMDRQYYSLGSGSLCLLPPESFYTIQAESAPCVYRFFLPPDILEYVFSLSQQNNIFVRFFVDAAFDAGKNKSPGCLSGFGDDYVCRLAEEMYQEELHRDCYSNEILLHMFMILLNRLLRSCSNLPQLTASPSSGQGLSVIARYLIQNYPTASLAELAQLLNYSVPYCSRYVRENTGFTFSQLQKKIRMQKAINCLLHTDMQINHIGDLIGYSSPDNFMKLFKQEYGCSPSQYRQRHRAVL